MDQVFITLEDHGIEVLDDDEVPVAAVSASEDDAVPSKKKASAAARNDEPAKTAFARGMMPEKIDDPVRMYLTQMGEIPLLTRRGGDFPRQVDRDHAQALPQEVHGLGALHGPHRSRPWKSRTARGAGLRPDSQGEPQSRSRTTTPRSSRRSARLSSRSACP